MATRLSEGERITYKVPVIPRPFGTPRKQASVFWTRKFLTIQSEDIISHIFFSVEGHFATGDEPVSDMWIAENLRQALQTSRMFTQETLPADKTPGELIRCSRARYAAYAEDLRKRYGYRTTDSVFAQALQVVVMLFEDLLVLRATNRRRGGIWVAWESGFVGRRSAGKRILCEPEGKYLRLSPSCTDEELARGVREMLRASRISGKPAYVEPEGA
ncbi:hypothetical protein GOB93_10845 [Acetobacter musti]|uniref:DUF1436 domain-containing protein n=1 Tax=Acetobacter musti TaxID=864732 RepID=A0ABX0JNZ6_9PROT|nr:hypothetical protein [Acetobacter musti]NHN85136.1 hypothetical protein [Acetobacter musti]